MKDELEVYLERYIDALSNELLDLSSICHLLKYFSEKNNIVNEYNISVCFFGTAESALFTKFILWTYKLLNNKNYKKERSLFGLLDFCEKNINIFEKERFLERCKGRDISIEDREMLSIDIIRRFKKELSEVKILNSIKIRRDKYHGHFDKDYFFLDDRKLIERDAPIMWTELEEMLQLAKNIINTITHKYIANSKMFEFMNVNDIDNVFDILKEHNEKLKQEAIAAGVYPAELR